MGFDEGADVPAVEKLEGGFAESVVAAGEDDGFKVQLVLAAELEGVLGEAGEEGGVVAGVEKLGAFGLGGEFVEVDGGADAKPEAAEGVEVEVAFQTLFDVDGGKAGPHDVGEIGGAVVEHVHDQAGVVGGGKEGVAGAETGADDGEAAGAAGFEPIEGAADVEHGLACRRRWSADIGRDGIVGALQFGRHPVVMVGQAEAEGGEAEALEHLGHRIVGIGGSVPVGQHEYGLGGVLGGEPLSVHDIIFRVGGSHVGGETEKAPERWKSEGVWCWKKRPESWMAN